jgi:hypothetical protein
VRAALLGLALLAAAAQSIEPPVLPAGQFCAHVTRANPRPAHPCGCQRHCSEGEGGDEAVVEDAQCKQYCHADHCHCPVKGCS